MSAGKTKYPRAAAIEVVRIILGAVSPACDPVVIAGSLRRRKAEVGDVEVLYIPKTETIPDGLFDSKVVNRMDCILEGMLGVGIIEKRLTERGSVTWGQSNKYARHVASGIPVDFFQANTANWFNLLVCRTGSAENNTRIASAAQRKGWTWKPYTAGFLDERGAVVEVRSERDVFDLVGLPYLEPWER